MKVPKQAKNVRGKLNVPRERCRHIVTHNVNDFHRSGQLGVTALSPCEFLNLIRKKS
jgi:hypothetical protein